MRKTFLLLAALLATSLAAHAAPATPSSDFAREGLPFLGLLTPRSALEIEASNWSIGGETLDRDYAVYANYREHLGPLGAKGIRLQAGWAKCEKQPGVYNWEWLDAIVDDAVAQGVRPWLETSYGNTIYEGGGDTGLGGGLPRSPDALAAWDRWVRALVRRYRDRVNQWEVWNEPDLGKKNAAEDYTALFVRTATIIRAEQPGARIYGLGLAGRLDFADAFLARLKQQGRTDLVDAITIHGYPRNPDDTSNIDKLRAIIGKHGLSIEARQGETGAPSQYQANFALSKIPWTENTQAKWDLRRMLAHHARGVPFNLFTISDMHYRRGGGLQMNYKGLLATNPDQTIARRKPAWFAARNVFSVFDDSLELEPDSPFAASTKETLAVHGWRKRRGGQPVFAVWFSGHPPVESNETTRVDLTLERADFTHPVMADLLSGRVHEIPGGRWEKIGKGVKFERLPVFDSPALIAERTAVSIRLE